MTTKQELFQKADKYKKIIMDSRPLTEREIKELENYFKIGLTYSSDAIEGNSLTLSETKILIEDGLTVGGKPLKDYLEAAGHAKAYDFMLEAAKAKGLEITEELIKKLHFLFYNGLDSENAGKYRREQVFISGTDYLPPTPEKVPMEMSNFITELNNRKKTLHLIEYAALLHKGIVDVHPFIDGNGRTARLAMNLVLVNGGYGVVSIPPVIRNEYINSLVKSRIGKKPNSDEFIKLIAECVIETQRDYCRLLRISFDGK